jgi:glyoxalase-like protein
VRSLLSLIVLSALTAAAAGAQQAPARAVAGAPVPRTDHVLLGIDSLARGIALFRAATGVTPVYGGTHTGEGTENALVSLGGGRYLEILAPNFKEMPGGHTGFARLRALTVLGWSVRTHDLDSLRQALRARGLRGTDGSSGTRRRPDGKVLRWRMLRPWGALSHLLPFFIEWDPAGPHPATDSPSGCSLASFAIASSAADTLKALFDRASLHVSVSPADRDVISIVLDCPKGRVSFSG